MTDEETGPVTVLETSDPALLGVAKSLLESAGIQYYAKGEGVQDLFAFGRFGTGFSPVAGPIQLQVPADDAPAAIEILKDLGEDADSPDDTHPPER